MFDFLLTIINTFYQCMVLIVIPWSVSGDLLHMSDLLWLEYALAALIKIKYLHGLMVSLFKAYWQKDIIKVSFQILAWRKFGHVRPFVFLFPIKSKTIFLQFYSGKSY